MKLNNKHRGLVLSSTFVGLVCGLVLTHQQAYAAQTLPVSNQQSQITTVSDNNPDPTAALNPRSYSSNISHPTSVSYNVTPNTYNSPETGLAAKQQPASSDATAAVATPNTGVTVPVANGTATSTNPGNNNLTNPVTSYPSQDIGNSASTPVAASDNQTNGNSTNTSTSSEQPETNIIDQGTWGTSKWDYVQEGADYILNLHAGTLGTPGKGKDNAGNIYDAGIGSLNVVFKRQLTKIIIDPGVIANQNSSGLFRYLKNLQTIQGLENLDTSQVTNMSRMFEYCESLTKLNLGSWNTSNVENVSWMFNECTNLVDLNLDNWSTLKVHYEGLHAMLNHCKSLSKLVLGPETIILTSALLPNVPEIGTKVPGTDTTVTASRWVATSGYQPGQLYTSAELMKILDRDQVTTYEWASQLNSNSGQDTKIIAQGTWGTSKWDYTQEGADYILHLHAGTLGTPEGNEGISSLNSAFLLDLMQIIIDPGVVANQNSRGLFSSLTNLQTIQGLENLDTSKVTDMSAMFDECESLTNLDISNFDTSQVTNMYNMFVNCYKLTNLDVSHFNTSQVTDMTGMFADCYGLTSLDVSHWDTSHVTDMSWMFSGCYNLTSLDVSHWDTSHVIYMIKIFCYCESLTNLDVSHWDTSHVTDMSMMFADCENLTSLDLSSFDTSQLFNEYFYFTMLTGCTNLHHLVLGPKIQLIDPNGWTSDLPAVPAVGTKIPGTDKTVTAPYWVATSGYQQGKRYTSDELQQLTGRDQVTTYDWDSQPLFASTVATKAVIRTINVHNPDGTMQTEHQIATLTQEIKNNADGTQTLGPWSTGQWQAYAVPEITGYTADPTEVAAQTVTDSTVNQTIDVYYEPVVQQITVNYLENGKIVGTQILTGYAGETIIPQYRAPKGYEIIDRPQGELTFSTDKQQIVQIPVQAQIIPTSESKVLIRTVNIHLPSGNLKTYRQPVVLTRTVYLNAVSGEKTYDDWSTGHWGAITVPVVAGYTASQAQVAAQTVTAQDSDQLLDIYYTKA